MNTNASLSANKLTQEVTIINPVIYCSTCLEKVSKVYPPKFVCDNKKCPSPYTFNVFLIAEEAYSFYEEVESWRPKFVFERNGLWFVTYCNAEMKPFIPRKLSDILDDNELLLLEKGLSDELNRAVTIIDMDGSRIDRLSNTLKNNMQLPVNSNPFCTELRSTKRNDFNGDGLCKNCDNLKHSEIKNNKCISKEVWYYCWAGLIDYAIPIKVDECHLATAFSGQLRLLDSGTNGADKKLTSKIEELADRYSLNKNELINIAFSNQVKPTSIEELHSKHIPQLQKAVELIQGIAGRAFRSKAFVIEQLFLEEISFYLEKKNKGPIINESLDYVLKRLADFFGLENCYFLFTPNYYRTPFEIYGAADRNKLNFKNIDTKFIFDTERLKGFDSLFLFSLKKDKYIKDLVNLQNLFQLEKNINHDIWIGTCPLIGTNHGVFVFQNPISNERYPKSFRMTTHESDFLRRFCITAREKLNNALSFNAVLQRLGHELTFAVQAIVANNSVIQSKSDVNSEVFEYAKRNSFELKQHYNLVENLKTLFVISNSKSYIFKPDSLKKEIVNIVECIKDEALRNSGVYFKNVEFKGKSSLIYYDKRFLPRALFNMIQNAVKYSFTGKYISVICEEDAINKLYVISIDNYGVGITKKEIDKKLIFKEGYRGILSKDYNRTGCGLGLSIASEIIRCHNGDISVRSTPPKKSPKGHYISVDGGKEVVRCAYGYNTVFTIKLPFYQKD